MFRIELTPEAADDLASFRKTDQARIVEAIEEQLIHTPMRQTRNRKQLRPNRLAEWELRVGEIRVFYDADDEEERVTIVAVGHKEGSVLYLRGERFEL